MMRSYASFVVFLLSTAFAAGATPESDPKCELRLLSNGNVIQKGLDALKNREETEAAQRKLAQLQERKAFIEKYFGPQGYLAYPQSLVFLAAFAKEWEILGYRVALADGYYTTNGFNADKARALCQSADSRLRNLFRDVSLEPPATPQDAQKQADLITSRAKEVRQLVWGAGNRSDKVKESWWPSPEEFRELAKMFKAYHAEVPPAGAVSDKIFMYWLNERKLKPAVAGSDYALKSGGQTFYFNEFVSDPRGGGFLGTGVFTPAGRANADDVRRLSETNREIAKVEKKLRALTDGQAEALKAPVAEGYRPPEVVKAVIPDASKNGADQALAYREALSARYLDAGGFFSTAFGKKVLDGSESLSTALSLLSADRVPVQKENGAFADSDLESFRETLAKLQMNPNEHLRYANELRELASDPGAQAELKWLMQDRRQGDQGMKALRLLAAEKQKPAPKPPSVVTEAGVQINHGTPYVRPYSADVALHTALTALAHETAGRGHNALPKELLREVTNVGKSLEKPLRKGTLTRTDAIRTLSPAIDRAVLRSQAQTIDLARMEHDLAQVRQRIVESTAEATRRGEAQLVAAKDPATAPHPAELEETDMRIVELKHQLATADQLARSIATLKAGVKEQRELVTELQNLLHRVDAAAPNAIDTKAIAAVLAKLDKLSQ